VSKFDSNLIDPELCETLSISAVRPVPELKQSYETIYSTNQRRPLLVSSGWLG